MFEDFTRYTDRILSAVSTHFDIEPRVRNRRTGKISTGNLLPVLHHIMLETQQAYAGMFSDFSDPEKIMKSFFEYTRMVSAINIYAEFVPTRANYCAYMGISTSMYQRMLRDAPQSVRDALCYVEDYFVSLLQIGALNGDVSVNAAKLTLQTAGQYGHNQVTVKEMSDIRVAEHRLKSPEELEAELKRLTSGK